MFSDSAFRMMFYNVLGLISKIHLEHFEKHSLNNTFNFYNAWFYLSVATPRVTPITGASSEKSEHHRKRTPWRKTKKNVDPNRTVGFSSGKVSKQSLLFKFVTDIFSMHIYIYSMYIETTARRLFCASSKLQFNWNRNQVYQIISIKFSRLTSA